MFRNASLSIIIGIAIIALISMIATKIQGPHYYTILRRRARYGSNDLLQPYRAALTGRETPYTIEQSYIVDLHHGSSLAEHRATIGRPDLETNIRYIFPDGAVMGVAYVSENIDDETLDNIRADFRVNLVVCECGGEPALDGMEVHES